MALNGYWIAHKEGDMASLINEPQMQRADSAVADMPQNIDGDRGGNWEKLGDAARRLGVSEITLRRRVKAGRLQHDFRGGRYFVFIPSGVNARHFLDSQESDAGSSAQGSMRPSENILGPYPGHAAGKSSERLTQHSPAGPNADQILAIVKIELQQKQLEIDRLTRELQDQVTLNEALEAALEEATSRGI
jgi:hypothetical protein